MLVLTTVGAILLFLGLLSSFSLSLASRFEPNGPVRGVSGGVVIGTPPILAETGDAVTVGMVPLMSVGLLTTPVMVDWVATEDVEFDRVGDEGRCIDTDAGGEGAVNDEAELRCW